MLSGKMDRCIDFRVEGRQIWSVLSRLLNLLAPMIQQIIFIVVSVLALDLAILQFWHIRKKILLGKPEKIEGDRGVRIRNVLLIAFGQRKMFKEWGPALLHFCIYAAFLITQIELFEIFFDGISGMHRAFAPLLGG